MNCTRDWFTWNVPLWRRMLEPLVGRPCMLLEVGSYEGRSAVWLLENVCTHARSRLVCVDPWGGAPAGGGHESGDAAEQLFDANTARFGAKCLKVKQTSREALRWLRGPFNFAYVDGLHEAQNALEDGVLAFPLLASGGLMAFDDYDYFPAVKVGVDAFLSAYGALVEVVSAEKQVWIRKR